MASSNTITPEKQYQRDNINICRLCGESENFKKATLLFGNAGQEKKINECIKRTLNIEITEKEDPECKVCRSCQSLLKRFDVFKTTALKTQEIFKSRRYTKRCSKSPLAVEAEKRCRDDSNMNDGNGGGPLTLPQTVLPPRRLTFDANDDISPNVTQPMQLTEAATRNDEKLSLATFGLHDKPVCTLFYL